MKTIVKQIDLIIKVTKNKLQDEKAKKLHDESLHWKNVTRKEHWEDMNRLGEDHPDVINKINDVKSKGLDIILRFDLTFPNDDQ